MENRVFLKKLTVMRKVPFFFLPFFLFLTSAFTHHKLPEKIRHVTAQQQNFDPNDWIIEEATAKRMAGYYRDCRGGKCRPFKKKTFNYPTEIDNYIKQNYTIVSSWLQDSRYDDEDVDRYRRTRNIPAGDPRGDVSGYATKITVYQVISKTGSLFPQISRLYIDNLTICPPPETPPCN